MMIEWAVCVLVLVCTACIAYATWKIVPAVEWWLLQNRAR